MFIILQSDMGCTEKYLGDTGTKEWGVHGCLGPGGMHGNTLLGGPGLPGSWWYAWQHPAGRSGAARVLVVCLSLIHI